MLVKQILLLAALAGLMLGVCGCAPSIVGTDAGVYHARKLHAVASQDLTTVYQATVKALESLELTVTEKAKDVFSAKVVAKGADGKTVSIRIKPGEGDLTKLSIRVGPLGNQHRSEVIYEQIKRHLGGRGK
ncbi:MAG: DUF3568 family protein [Planctomycetota bacterium]|jgi:hypothetical protein